jgi:hypothetical protein
MTPIPLGAVSHQLRKRSIFFVLPQFRTQNRCALLLKLLFSLRGLAFVQCKLKGRGDFVYPTPSI